MNNLRIAHISDSHIGYQAYRHVNSKGENQRSADVRKAFEDAVKDVIALDPPLVVHSGDIAEKPVIASRHMLFILRSLQAMASIRPDGSRRQVLIIAGNHDLPAQRNEPCFLELFANVPGVHVVTDRLKTIEFEAGADIPTELSDVAVTALPHDTLKEFALDARFDEVQPVANKVNILVAHGVAGGSTLYRRTIGREYVIPTEVLARNWDYAALGHWHKRGPVSQSATTEHVENSRAWYAGSTENMGFGDLDRQQPQRGWLSVTVRHGELPIVEKRNVPNRAMFHLPELDGQGMDAAAITEALLQRMHDAKERQIISGSVIAQKVINVPRDIWSMVETNQIRQLASDALHFELAPLPVKAAPSSHDVLDPEQRAEALGGFDALIERLGKVAEVVLANEPPEMKDAALAVATRELANEMRATVDQGEDSE